MKNFLLEKNNNIFDLNRASKPETSYTDNNSTDNTVDNSMLII